MPKKVEMEKRKRRSFDLKTMQEHAEKLGGQCLAKEYKNSTYKLLFQCEKGHKWRATPLEIMGKKNSQGKWCPTCEE